MYAKMQKATKKPSQQIANYKLQIANCKSESDGILTFSLSVLSSAIGKLKMLQQLQSCQDERWVNSDELTFTEDLRESEEPQLCTVIDHIKTEKLETKIKTVNSVVPSNPSNPSNPKFPIKRNSKC